jgi:2-isopropylmalate synthase
MATATVRLRGPDGSPYVRAAVGTGPVDAAFKAIDDVVRAPLVLREFAVRAVTEGIDALGEVSVRIERAEGAGDDGSRVLVFNGHAADTDIVVASARAYVAAINRMLACDEEWSWHREGNVAVTAPAAAVEQGMGT